ncbi:MAG: response regulator transcription factor [Blastochloris sp.]|nr:response regulator transcription factor [Blastochloris sp.]
MGRVIVIERHRGSETAFSKALERRYEIASATSGKAALLLASTFRPQVVVLDAISMRTPGDRISRQLKDVLPAATLLIHLCPSSECESAADVVLMQPFTARKLVNAIERLLNQTAPTPARSEIVTCGEFTLDLARRVLDFNGQEMTLTPKLSLLIEMFLRHPGETLERKRLMEHVWQTSYLGDTRTLDVHVRWFRRIIETDPNKPKYLRTVRGVGYRLDLPFTAEPVNALNAAPLTLQGV